MLTLAQLEKTQSNTYKFAVGCFETNTLIELLEALALEITDSSDRKEWKINATQWRTAIVAALYEQIMGMLE